MEKKITTVFTDIGGVLLTNGWDRKARAEAVQLFKLDGPEMEERHHLTFDTYESGKLSLDEYLDRIVFYRPRDFSKKDFSDFMFECSQPYNDMLQMMEELKKKYRIKIAVVNNEGRELNAYRINKFKLNSFVDFFISSCFVHFRKPDKDIFRVALDVAHVLPEEVVYLEDRPMFVAEAVDLGIHGLCHKGYEATKAAFAEYGLAL